MIYLLDTNTLSFAMAGDTTVCGRLLAEARTDVRLPRPVVAEIAYGLARMPSSKKRTRLTDRFRLFLDEMARDHWTDDVSHASGRIKADLERRGVRLENWRDRTGL